MKISPGNYPLQGGIKALAGDGKGKMKISPRHYPLQGWDKGIGRGKGDNGKSLELEGWEGKFGVTLYC
jgi:hypothetical protein